MVIIADTSVWIAHFRQKNHHLEALLNEALIAVHPFIVGELACGRLKNRREILSLLQALPEASLINQTELLHFIDKRGLVASGIGFVDAHLLASTELMRGLLWTSDKGLQHAAARMDLAYV